MIAVSKEGQELLRMSNDVVESMDVIIDYFIDVDTEEMTGFDCYQLGKKNKQIKRLAAEIDMYISVQEDFLEYEEDESQ